MLEMVRWSLKFFPVTAGQTLLKKLLELIISIVSGYCQLFSNSDTITFL